MLDILTRTLPETEIRIATPAGQPAKITGYAAVFNRMSEDLGGFREQIHPGAFAKTLADGADVRALMNHDANFVLGRTRSGTLTLREDERGLWMEITPPDTQWARDLMESVKRGDVNQSSFAFRSVKDDWGQALEGQRYIDVRNLHEVRLFDVSVVTFPAYPQTQVSVRSALQAAGVDIDALAEAMLRAQHGQPLSEPHIALLRSTAVRLRSYLPAEEPAPVPAGPPSGATLEPSHSGHSLADCLLRLAAFESQYD